MSDMKLQFTGDVAGLEAGIGVLAPELGLTVGAGGLPVRATRAPGARLQVRCGEGGAEIVWSERVHFFRALGLLAEALRAGKTAADIAETPQFDTVGVMFDVAQGNAAINVMNIKDILRRMALMGLNMLMIYTEDNYEVAGEPYFGYMRGRYAPEELRECDAYADSLGIEMIPCMQTLAHLVDAIRWSRFSAVAEDEDTLLVGAEPGYELIERLIVSASSAFRTKRIHIGMDEAWKLGQGRYLLQNGHRRKLDIMTEHLGRVLEITRRHGLKPMIWSDMYFRAASSNGTSYYEAESAIPQDVLDAVPGGVQFVYWDYEHLDAGFYAEWIRRHRQLGSDPVFAGGSWTWNGFGADYDKTFATSNAALEACKSAGLREVFVTVWGDGGTESSVYENLLAMQLFAEHGYARELDGDKLRRRFKACTGCEYDDFYSLTYVDKPRTEEARGGYFTVNASKYLLWQDPMMGLFDANAASVDWRAHYARLRDRFEAARSANGAYGFVFELMEKLCAVLELKADIGLRIAEAYRAGRREELRSIADADLFELSKRLETLRQLHRRQWHDTNQPFGWEILDIRYGGLAARLDSAAKRILDYLEGRVERLEELERERLPFDGQDGLVFCNAYRMIASASRLSI